MIVSLRATAVLCGGAAGAACRYALAAPTGGFPFGILFVNTLGCLLMGLLQGAVSRTGRPSDTGYCLLGTGFLGGFTTFSSLALDAFLLWRSGRPALAAADVALNVGLGVGAVCAGYELAMRLPSKRRAAVPGAAPRLPERPR